MTSIPNELTATAVIDLISSGAYPRDIVLTIANGFLPLAQEDLIGVLSYLALADDEEIAATAARSLADIPSRTVLSFASDENADPEMLARLMRATRDNTVLEALIRNRAVADAAVAELAERADGAVQEVIVINQYRILRAPEILDALLENPQLTPDVRRRALEVKEEFFEKKARLEALHAAEEEEEEVADLPLDAIADLLEKAEQEGADSTPPLQLSESELKDDKKAAMWSKIQFLTISEKVQLAFKGDRTARMVLVRERNKLICSAVMRNPRMTDQEVESIAGMRNVDDEVLRLISLRRAWMGKYNILWALCRNPKTPVGVVLPLINRLTLRDLKGLKDDKGVSHVVREMAKKAYLSRSRKTG